MNKRPFGETQRNILFLSVLPRRRLLLLLVELLDHLPHLGAKLRVGRPQLVLVLFELVIFRL